jgi:hypothetical protein
MIFVIIQDKISLIWRLAVTMLLSIDKYWAAS